MPIPCQRLIGSASVVNNIKDGFEKYRPSGPEKALAVRGHNRRYRAERYCSGCTVVQMA